MGVCPLVVYSAYAQPVETLLLCGGGIGSELQVDSTFPGVSAIVTTTKDPP